MSFSLPDFQRDLAELFSLHKCETTADAMRIASVLMGGAGTYAVNAAVSAGADRDEAIAEAQAVVGRAVVRLAEILNRQIRAIAESN